MRNSEKFWDKLSASYEKGVIKNISAYNKTLDATKKHLRTDDIALDLGCGTGSIALKLAHSVEKITGVDISSKMIKIAKEKAISQETVNVEFLKSNLFDEKFTKGSYNVILAFNILHLLENTPKVMQRIAELLKPGGLFISGTVCLGEDNKLLRILLPTFNKLNLLPHVNNFNIAELESYMTNETFEIIETEIYFPTPPVRFIVSKKKI